MLGYHLHRKHCSYIEGQRYDVAFDGNGQHRNTDCLIGVLSRVQLVGVATYRVKYTDRIERWLIILRRTCCQHCMYKDT